MAQFDVHRNVARNRSTIPYLVVVQSQRWRAYTTRLVVPLIAPQRIVASELTPLIAVEGGEWMLDPLHMFAIPVEMLGPVVATCADDVTAFAIVSAIDEAISRGYR